MRKRLKQIMESKKTVTMYSLNGIKYTANELKTVYKSYSNISFDDRSFEEYLHDALLYGIVTKTYN